MRYLRLVSILFIVSILLTSCVTKKKYLYLEGKYYDAYDDNKRLEKELVGKTAQNEADTKLIREYKNEIQELKADTSQQGKSLRSLKDRYKQLNSTYLLLEKTSKRALEGTTAEIFNVQKQLLETQRILEEKEQRLNETALVLAEREKSLQELQSILDKQKQMVEALKKKVSAALLGFENNGLTIEIKNGKVYISLEEKLLFATGSSKVDSKGEEALKKLAEMLQTNTEINVLIEGHTDDVPYVSNSGSIKDNWDLSVLRATSIIRILLKHGEIDPVRLTPAGRGEFLPIATEDTKEARAKNRRIEIILTPKLDELFQIIESN
ncbi:MAG: OmpA family protein [Bacteroidetes bacterium]|nr:OmpA family protein [Bacteroidota bacterium]